MCPSTLTRHFIHCSLPIVKWSWGWQISKKGWAILTVELKIICLKAEIWLNFLLKGIFAKKSSWSVTSHRNPALEFHASRFNSCKGWDVIRLSLLVLLKVVSKKSNMTSKTRWISIMKHWAKTLCMDYSLKWQKALYIAVSCWEAGKQLSPFCSALVTPDMWNIKLPIYSSSTGRTKLRD